VKAYFLLAGTLPQRHKDTGTVLNSSLSHKGICNILKIYSTALYSVKNVT
jgi:hypothetical protein